MTHLAPKSGSFRTPCCQTPVRMLPIHHAISETASKVDCASFRHTRISESPPKTREEAESRLNEAVAEALRCRVALSLAERAMLDIRTTLEKMNDSR